MDLPNLPQPPKKEPSTPRRSSTKTPPKAETLEEAPSRTPAELGSLFQELVGGVRQELNRLAELAGEASSTEVLGVNDISVAFHIVLGVGSTKTVLRNSFTFYDGLSHESLPELEGDVAETLEKIILRPLRARLHQLVQEKVVPDPMFDPALALPGSSGFAFEQPDTSDDAPHEGFEDDDEVPPV